MALNLSRRNQVLGGLLLATLAVSAWTLLAAGTDESVVEPVARPARGTVPAAHKEAAESTATDLALGQRPEAPPKVVNLFSAYSYQAQAARPAGAEAPVRPHAPPLPFTYTGRLEIDGVSTYLMMQGDVPLGVTVGTAIGDFTLIEATGNRLVFLHGPTNERVEMPIAAPPN